MAVLSSERFLLRQDASLAVYKSWTCNFGIRYFLTEMHWKLKIKIKLHYRIWFIRRLTSTDNICDNTYFTLMTLLNIKDTLAT